MANEQWRLPPEIMAQILTQTLPTPVTTARKITRNSLLKNYSLICRQWRQFGQSELFLHPVLPSSLSVDHYLDASGKLGGAITMVLGSDQWEEYRAFSVERLQRACPGVQEVELSEMEGVSLHELLKWKELRSLTLRSLRCHTPLNLRPHLLSSPRLTMLKLSAVDISQRLTSTLLTPEMLPSLVILALHSVAFIPLKPIAPQLQVLSLQNARADHENDISWKSLKAVDVNWGINTEEFFWLPFPDCSASHLRIALPMAELVPALVDLDKSVQGRTEWTSKLKVVDVIDLKQDFFESDVEEGDYERCIDRLRELGLEVRSDEATEFPVWARERTSAINM
ncbi:hypothetical protein T439DRAFT_381462 [Meredithblackwellia eburnea MCA 4105]